MSIQELKAEEIASDWSNRVGKRMASSGFPEEEIKEITFIIHQLTQVAVNALKQDPKVVIPNSDLSLTLTKEQAFEVLDLFIRGISKIAKLLRHVEQPHRLDWETRRDLLEKTAWETFIMAKLMVGNLYLDTPVKLAIRDQKDFQVLMNQSTDEILKRHLPPGTKFPDPPPSKPVAPKKPTRRNPYYAPIPSLKSQSNPSPPPESGSPSLSS